MCNSPRRGGCAVRKYRTWGGCCDVFAAAAVPSSSKSWNNSRSRLPARPPLPPPSLPQLFLPLLSTSTSLLSPSLFKTVRPPDTARHVLPEAPRSLVCFCSRPSLLRVHPRLARGESSRRMSPFSITINVLNTTGWWRSLYAFMCRPYPFT